MAHTGWGGVGRREGGAKDAPDMHYLPKCGQLKGSAVSCVLTLKKAYLVGMRSYLGEGALLGQRALVGLSEQLLQGIPHRVVAPLLRRQLLQPRKATHRARSAITHRSSRRFCVKKN